jgi:DNA replication protein DnaC
MPVSDFRKHFVAPNLALRDDGFLNLKLINQMLDKMDKATMNDLVLDDSRITLINQLFYWLLKDKQFKGNINKGILIAGRVGNGKTTLMNAFIETLNETNLVAISYAYAYNIREYFEEENSQKKHYYIDDLGKEPEKVTANFTQVNPLPTFVYERYNSNRFTFATTNVLKSLSQQLSASIFSRIQEMFNFFVLDAPQLRDKSTEIKL